jgi:hypothetical protein
MRECGQCLLDAIELGHVVLHRSGEEGIDELWGEPFRAFSVSIEEFYESRYIKIGQTLRDIDRIAQAMIANFSRIPAFAAIEAPVRILPAPPESRPKPCAPTRTSSTSGHTGDRRRTARQLHTHASEQTAGRWQKPAASCTALPTDCSCSETAAHWSSTSPAPARRCRRAPATTSRAAKLTSPRGRVPCLPAPLPA